jgi:hypothetical protein
MDEMSAGQRLWGASLCVLAFLIAMWIAWDAQRPKK